MNKNVLFQSLMSKKYTRFVKKLKLFEITKLPEYILRIFLQNNIHKQKGFRVQYKNAYKKIKKYI